MRWLAFLRITGKRLPRWTSSLFRRSPSARSIAFSASVTIRRRKWKCFSQLLDDPQACRMLGDIEVQDAAPRFVIFDRDARYGLEVPAAVRSVRVNPIRTLVRKSLAEWSRRALGRELSP